MGKEDKNNKNPKGIPIKLNDLLPRDNVTGGKSKNVFGAINKTENKRRNPS